jgi:iron complex transport system substrate-binding protein
MQICSFLPSATEIIYALGMGESVSGVTFECDYPPEASRKPVVVNSLIHSGLTPLEIDQAVRKQIAAGGSLYFVDMPRLEEMQPDVVVTQDLCRVCAISTPDVAKAISELSSHPRVISLAPHTIDQVFQDIETVGAAIGRHAEAMSLLHDLRGRVERVKSNVRPGKPLRVLCLEWLSPLFQGGHWIPEMVALAGGNAVLATAGERSICISWEQIWEADPEVIVVMPCGFHLEDTVTQYGNTAFPEDWKDVSAVRNNRVYAVDGTAYFSRPGPRLVSGIEILEAILRDDGLDQLPSGSVSKLSLTSPDTSHERSCRETRRPKIRGAAR